MKYVRIGEYQENALERIEKYEASDFLTKGILKRIDLILNLIVEEFPKELDNYVSNLMEIYEVLLKKTNVLEESFSEILLEDESMLKQYPDLMKYIVSYYLQNLNIDFLDQLTNELKITQRNHFRSFLLPRYNNLTALIKTLGREKAVKFYKRFITLFYIQMEKPPNRNFVNLTEHYHKVSQRTATPSDWITIFGLMDNGKYFYINENCLWVEALADIEDSELLYLICCYGDYQNAQRFYNKYIILTMEHTIAQGDPYCSRVLHDTREDWDLRHPEKEFWDNLQKS